MIEDYVLIGIIVLFSVMMLVMLGQKLRIAYPIFLVIAGLIISLVPGIPHVMIEPDLVFLIFLPPILFEAAWFTSWQDFRKWKRTIFSMAFGLVFITSIVVALVSTAIIPGLTLALGFLLGGINSPPDAVAATSVLKQMKIPKKITSILEGESLINDASSLIVFKFALAAALTGQFVLSEAVGQFFIMAIGGTAVGLLLGWMFGGLLRIIPSNSNIDTIMTLLAPYVMYLAAEHFHFSGVLAVVAGGLLMSYNSYCYLSHTSRLQAGNVWSVLIFLMNTMIFVLIGLELPVVVKGLSEYTIGQGIYYSLIIGTIIIATRIVYCYAIVYLPYMFSEKYRKSNPKPNWKEAFILSFAAMRGVVSLAAALSIPVLLPNGDVFPHRNIILLVTFIIILITLVGQGLLLGPILKLLKIEENTLGIPKEKQELIMLKSLKQVALDKINGHYTEDLHENRLIHHQKMKLENELMLLENKSSCLVTNENYVQNIEHSKEVMRNLIKAQRSELRNLKKNNLFDDEVIRTAEMQLDLEEAKITGFQD